MATNIARTTNHNAIWSKFIQTQISAISVRACSQKLSSNLDQCAMAFIQANVFGIIVCNCQSFCIGLNVFIQLIGPWEIWMKFIYVISKQILVIDDWGISCEIAIISMSLNFTDDQSTLVQVMAWCLHATSHYLSQCWHRFLSPFAATRPQWVNACDMGAWPLDKKTWQFLNIYSA